MKLRRAGSRMADKIDIPMAPMIDVVFQLLIFFMLTLNIIAPEGSFDINMPLAQATQNPDPVINLPPIKVRMVADANGNLAQLQLTGRNLGNDDGAFGRLNSDVLRIIGSPGNPLMDELEVEIDADYNLHYRYIVKAISAVSGRMNEQGQIVRYVEKIKFAPPRRPG